MKDYHQQKETRKERERESEKITNVVGVGNNGDVAGLKLRQVHHGCGSDSGMLRHPLAQNFLSHVFRGLNFWCQERWERFFCQLIMEIKCFFLFPVPLFLSLAFRGDRPPHLHGVAPGDNGKPFHGQELKRTIDKELRVGFLCLSVQRAVCTLVEVHLITCICNPDH